ncbi:SDR family oxidoreductase [Streptomyces sp. OR43]|uniref:SDR family oxidoreductase n=1 Tax=Streptomyces sp. or43 TaxID=2478957 RepID=UPI0021C793A9|nr:NAD(P)-dependent oxidoreductase [Streptomyces sp. or43]
MLGQDLVAALAHEDVTAVAADRTALDIADPGRVRDMFATHRPAVVVNCAAWTAVDDAEQQEDAALRINGTGPAVLAAACREHGAVLETLPDTGYVVRTAWLYGAGGANFVRTMIRLEGIKDTLDVVDDQRGQPTWTVDLAARLVRLGRAALEGTAPAGVYHGTSSGETTWCGFAREIFRLLGADPARVRPTTSDAYPRPAPRPAYSVLAHHRFAAAGIEPVRDWRAALDEAFSALLAAERPLISGRPG